MRTVVTKWTEIKDATSTEFLLFQRRIEIKLWTGNSSEDNSLSQRKGGGEQKFIDDFLFKLWNLKLSS